MKTGSLQMGRGSSNSHLTQISVVGVRCVYAHQRQCVRNTVLYLIIVSRSVSLWQTLTQQCPSMGI